MVKVKLSKDKLNGRAGDIIAVFLSGSGKKLLEQANVKNADIVARELKKRDFQAQVGSKAFVQLLDGKQQLSYLCLGIREKKNKGGGIEVQHGFEGRRQMATLAQTLIATAKEHGARRVVVDVRPIDVKEGHVSFFVQSLYAASYSYLEFKKKSESKKGLEIVCFGALSKSLKKARAALHISSGVRTARDLLHRPPSHCTPRYVVGVCRKIARDAKLTVSVLDKKKLTQLKAHCLLGVSLGSEMPPYLVKLRFKPKKSSGKKLALVGKGVTFDSGGLSIKTGSGMELMKADMGGAAAVIGAMYAIGKLNPNHEVTGYIALTENMINGRAFKPGDVLRAVNGKTVEVQNTDAEGRLILADALSLAVKDKVDEIVDVATLTGACVVALGDDYAGLFSNSEKLQERLLTAGALQAERYWPLPLASEYNEHLKSSVADLRHMGTTRYGGAIHAALFLQHFVAETTWAHLDIAGPGLKGVAKSKGPGFAVGTLVEYVMNR